MPLWDKPQYPQHGLSQTKDKFCRPDNMSLLSLENKLEVWIVTVLHLHFSQFLLFSDSSMVLPNSSRNRVIHQDLGRAGWQSRTFPEILVSSCVISGNLESRLGFLELEEKWAWWGTWALPELLGESRYWKIIESAINSHRSCNLRAWSRKRFTVRDYWSCCAVNSSNFRCFNEFSPNSLHKCILSRWAWSAINDCCLLRFKLSLWLK